MSILTVSSRVSRLGVPIPEHFSGDLSPNMTLATKSGMCLSNEGSTRGGAYGADSMGPSMGATPSAAVLKVVSRLTKDSGAGSRGRWGPGAGTPARLSNSFIQSSKFSKYLIILSNIPGCCIIIISSLAS